MFKIREAVKEDCIVIEGLIKEFRAYNRMNRINDKRYSGEPKIDRKLLETDGFGEHRLIRIIVAEDEYNKQLIGYALYFFKYSSYSGKTLFLEDFYVKSNCRQSGTGRALLIEVLKEARYSCCDSAEWTCCDWNYNAINFYNKFGVKELPESEGWVVFKLDRQQMESMVNKSK